MANISIIDDDYSIELLVERLRVLGHSVERFASADDAARAIESIAASDLIVLDVIMPPPSAQQSICGGSTSGLYIYKEIRDKSVNVPILVYSGITDSDIKTLLQRDRNVTQLPKWNTPSLNDVIRSVDRLLGGEPGEINPRAFIVHGHDEQAKLDVKNYLQNTLHFSEPIILHEQPNMGRTLIEKFEDLSYDIDYVFVLLTPDDTVVSSSSNEEKRRSRQNVILEMGYFLGHFGRRSGRMILLYKGNLDLPSDISGIVYIDISNGVASAGEQIRREISHVG